MAVEITCMDLSTADLREAAARTQDAKAARRMLAIALVLDGRSRDEAAKSCGMDRQTLRDWAHRYNEGGLAGFRQRSRQSAWSAALYPAISLQAEPARPARDVRRARHGVQPRGRP